MIQTISFDDVLLLPQYSDIMSRSEVSLTNKLTNVNDTHLPIISSPMDTITENAMAVIMEGLGGFGIIHRYNTIEKQTTLVSSAIKSGSKNVGVAVGVGDDLEQRAVSAVCAGANIICVDVAHGHHVKVKYAIKVLRNTFGRDIHIMAGNVATLGAFNDLSDWGADSIRVSIGGGSICSTRIQTGHGIPTLQAVLNCSRSDRDTLLIADGGIRSSGDIVKALGAGADYVILGSLLAGTDETPGELVHSKGKFMKIYRGMASKEAQLDWRGKFSSYEGISHKVPHKGPVEDVINDLKIGINSGLSYSGARTIKEFQAKATFVKQSLSSQRESLTHIKD